MALKIPSSHLRVKKTRSGMHVFCTTLVFRNTSLFAEPTRVLGPCPGCFEIILTRTAEIKFDFWANQAFGADGLCLP